MTPPESTKRRTVLKKGAVVSSGLLVGGVTMGGTVAGHEGGVALLTNPRRELFHVAKDFGETVTLSADCVGDGEYHRYQAQFWSRRDSDSYVKRGQRSFLVRSNRQLTVTGTVTSGGNGTVVSEDAFDPGDLHELRSLGDCDVDTSYPPLKFKDDWVLATFHKMNKRA